MKKPSIYFRKEAIFFCVKNLSQKNLSAIWTLPLLVIKKLKIFEQQQTLFCNNRHIIPIVFTGIDAIDEKTFAKLRRGNNCGTIAEDIKEEEEPVTIWVFAPFKTACTLFEEFSSQRVHTYMVENVLPEDNPKKCKVSLTQSFPHFEVLETNLLHVN